MLKTITSSLPALHESSYTVVDVKFETGQNPAMDAVANHLEDSNSFQQQHQEFGEEDEEEGLQTPNSSPRPQEAVNNKRKRSIPKKFSVDEDENPLHKADKGALTTIFSSENGNIVKTEIDYSSHSYDDIAAPDQEDQGSFKMVESWDDEAAANAEGEDPGLVLQQQIAKERELATKANSVPRDDCPICGDKANGLHYGVYTCEGCKNFFKRSVVLTQKKPYICNNLNKCDVRIVIDMSGIKRKGARCQACRYAACLDAGMFHSGYPRSRGGRQSQSANNSTTSTPLLKEFLNNVRIVIDMSGIKRKGARCQACRYAACLDAGMFHSGYPRSRGGRQSQSANNSTTSTPLLKEFLNSGERLDKRQRMSFEEQHAMDTTSWDNMVQGVQEALTKDSPQKGAINGMLNDSSSSGKLGHEDSIAVDSEEMLARASEIFDTVLRDELEKEKSKNRELTSRLNEKEKQLKIAERQTESMKRHMVLSQGVAAEQQAEIKRLRNEINRLSMFRSTVRNYQEQASDEHEVNPADMLAVSYNNE